MHTAVTTVTLEEKRQNLVGIKLWTSGKNAQELPYTHCSFQGYQNLGPIMAAFFSGNCCYISKELQKGKQLNCNGVTGDAEPGGKMQRGLKWNGMQGPEMYTY
jgi:hypothetical protein